MRRHGLVAAAVSALALSACTPAAASPAFTGIAKSIDGDSLYVGAKEVRLFGIDASEYRQTCTRDKKQGCVIKGNRGLHGWIYHLPGMPYYEQTRAEEFFCSEAAAQAAGYRRAIVK